MYKIPIIEIKGQKRLKVCKKRMNQEVYSKYIYRSWTTHKYLKNKY